MIDQWQYRARLLDAERQWLFDRLGGRMAPAASESIAPEGVCVLDNYDCLMLPELVAIREAMNPEEVAAAGQTWSGLGQRLEHSAVRFCAGVVAVIEGTDDRPGWFGVSGSAAVGAARRFTASVVELATGVQTIGDTLGTLATGIGRTRELLPLVDSPADPSQDLFPAEGAFKAIDHVAVEAESNARWILRTVYAPVIEQTDGGVAFLVGPAAVVERDAPEETVVDDERDRLPVLRSTGSDMTNSGAFPDELAPRDLPAERHDLPEGAEKGADSVRAASAKHSQPIPASNPSPVFRPDTVSPGPGTTPADPNASSPISVPRPVDDRQPANTPHAGPAQTTPSDSRPDTRGANPKYARAHQHSESSPIGEQRSAPITPLARRPSEPAAAIIQQTSSTADRIGQSPHLVGMASGPARSHSDAGRRITPKDYLVHRRNGERLIGVARIPKTVPPVLGGQ